jgi:hypothetical protein
MDTDNPVAHVYKQSFIQFIDTTTAADHACICATIAASLASTGTSSM